MKSNIFVFLFSILKIDNFMKTLIKVLLFFLFFILYACDDNNNNVQCFTHPPGFTFEIVDKTTGENLFTNGTYKSGQIIVTDLATNLKVPFSFISENGINILSIQTIGWKTEKVNYTITIQDKKIFELYADVSRLNGDNCSYTVHNQVLIKETEYELNKEKGTYIIKVPIEK
jgi:hypothetical protein